jgi:hypothetical protein
LASDYLEEALDYPDEDSDYLEDARDPAEVDYLEEENDPDYLKDPRDPAEVGYLEEEHGVNSDSRKPVFIY